MWTGRPATAPRKMRAYLATSRFVRPTSGSLSGLSPAPELFPSRASGSTSPSTLLRPSSSFIRVKVNSEIDHDGRVRGMAVYWTPYPAVISVSIIEKCVDMFMHFDRVARPVLGINFRTIAMLDVQCQEDISDFGINAGFLVDEVYNPIAEDLGIKCGNVIISINGQGALTLPELEDYLLSLGSDYLKDKSICMKDAKLRVFDLKSDVERDVTLPVRFYDKAEWDEEFYRMSSDGTS